MARKNLRPDPMMLAIDRDAFEWLNRTAPYYVGAIRMALEDGQTPEDIRHTVSMQVGPERQGLALRCEQAARHIKATE